MHFLPKGPWDNLRRRVERALDLPPGSTDPNSSIIEDLKKSHEEEMKAVGDYASRAGRARRAGREDIAQMYEHIMEEERHHLSEILEKM